MTAYNNGTSNRMMDLHYRNTIGDSKILAEFWALTPKKLMTKKPAVDLPVRIRIDWPDKKVLEKLVWSKPLMHAAKDFGVSDVALRKQCVKLGIKLPKRGHWLRPHGGAG
jgi:hypothetical protein